MNQQLPINGMTLLDYFADQATEEDIQEYMWEVSRGARSFSKIQIRNRAEARYAYATEMMKARNKI